MVYVPKENKTIFTKTKGIYLRYRVGGGRQMVWRGGDGEGSWGQKAGPGPVGEVMTVGKGRHLDPQGLNPKALALRPARKETFPGCVEVRGRRCDGPGLAVPGQPVIHVVQISTQEY